MKKRLVIAGAVVAACGALAASGLLTSANAETKPVTPAGGLKDLVVANEYAGSDKAPGFHAVTGGANLDGHDVPSFGYYAGPAAKITSTGGVVAHQAKWSADPNVVVFWFDSAADPGHLRAYDAAGDKLPTGLTGVGHG